jgi:signal transduction histidine kinase
MRERARGRIALVVIWLCTTLALAIWWLIHGLTQIDRLNALENGNSVELTRWHRMYVSEGATLVVLLFVGGAALLYYIATEMSRTRRVREFFAAFTHDLKTPLASLRLQAESLEEDLQGAESVLLARRLVKDTVRLTLQLENSLFLAGLATEDGTSLHIEKFDARDEFLKLQYEWPDLEVAIDGDATIEADSRAFESIVKNILQNALVHGRATRANIKIRSIAGSSDSLTSSNYVCLKFSDDGQGFKGMGGRHREQFGKIFHRPSASSGSGIGLYLVETLAKRMGGGARFIIEGPIVDGSDVGNNDETRNRIVIEVILPESRPVTEFA